MKRRTLLLPLAALGLVGLALAACTEGSTTVVAPSQAEGLSVSGEGSAFGAPDVAMLTLGVSAERRTVAEARQDAANAMEAMLGTMKDNGIEEDDIQTSQFSVQPEYDYDEGRQTLRGFRVTNVVTAKLRDIDKTGEVIDDALQAGGDLAQVQSVEFTIDDPEELRQEARREAMEDARQKAETLADLADVELGKPVSISETFAPPPPIPYELAGRGAAEEAAPVTPIEAGELEVQVQVQVIYAIE